VVRLKWVFASMQSYFLGQANLEPARVQAV
jgi:hypothetical protein